MIPFYKLGIPRAAFDVHYTHPVPSSSDGCEVFLPLTILLGDP